MFTTYGVPEKRDLAMCLIGLCSFRPSKEMSLTEKSEVIEKSVVLIIFAARFRAWNGGLRNDKNELLNIKCYGTYTYLHLDQGNTEF